MVFVTSTSHKQLFLWIFGPIPMFCSCICLVVLFYFLDFTVEFRGLSDEECILDDTPY